jgi:hypothetical protein
MASKDKPRAERKKARKPDSTSQLNLKREKRREQKQALKVIQRKSRRTGQPHNLPGS